MLGERFIAPTSLSETIEGVITYYDEESGAITIITDDGDKYNGYEYQLESVLLEEKDEISIS